MKLQYMKKNDVKVINEIKTSSNPELIHLASLGFYKNNKVKYLFSAPFLGSRAYLINGSIVSLPLSKCQLIEVL